MDDQHWNHVDKLLQSALDRPEAPSTRVFDRFEI
jgi:hypothetical protein